MVSDSKIGGCGHGGFSVLGSFETRIDFTRGSGAEKAWALGLAMALSPCSELTFRPWSYSLYLSELQSPHHNMVK